MQTLTRTTIQVSDRALQRGVVLVDLQEYKKLQMHSVPTIYLTGKKALEADRLVEEGMREYEKGDMISASSLREAMQEYGTRKRKKNTLRRKIS